MSHWDQKFVAVKKSSLEHLLKCAAMVEDFHELQHAVAQLKKEGTFYNEVCVELERRAGRYCDRE